MSPRDQQPFILFVAGALLLFACSVAFAQGIVDPVAQGTTVEDLLAALSVPVLVAGGVGSLIRNVIPAGSRWASPACVISGLLVTCLWTGDWSGKGLVIGLLAGMAAHSSRELVVQTASERKRPPPGPAADYPYE